MAEVKQSASGKPLIPQGFVDENRKRQLFAPFWEMLNQGRLPREVIVGDVVKRGHVGRQRFYQLFSGKRDFEHQALADAFEQGFGAVEDGGWEGFVRWADSNRAMLFGVVASGPEINAEEFEERIAHAVTLLGGGLSAEGAVGGAWHLLRNYRRVGQIDWAAIENCATLLD